MIGSLRGSLVARLPTGEVLVEVGGVGYRATVSPTTMSALGPIGAEVLVHTHLHVREDALTLYAFATADERVCFEALIGAHGVGPALALAILSVHQPDELRNVLADDDVDALCLVPGVGKKTALRLVVELKARFTQVEPTIDLIAIGGPDRSGPSVRSDVRDALVALGYGADEVREALRDLPDDIDAADGLKLALGRLAAA